MRALLVVLSLLCAPAAIAAGQHPVARAKDVYARAIELESQGDDAAALALLWEAAGLAPHDPDIQDRLGQALERIGALDAAVDAYRAAVSERPGFRQATNHLILALVKSGKADEAVARARALADAAPHDASSYFTLGLAQSEQDEAAAIKSFRRALELAPAHALARYNLALVLKRADRLQEAIDELHRAIAIEPRAEAYYTLGVIYWHQGELDRAASALNAAIAANPRYVDAHSTLGAVLKDLRDWDRAAAALRRAIALQPEIPGAHYTLGQVLMLSGNDQGAQAELAEAERLRRRGEVEQEARVWTVLGTQKLDGGNLIDALDCFRRATTSLDTYAPAHYQMGRTLQRLGQNEAAAAAYARARQLNASLIPPRD